MKLIWLVSAWLALAVIVFVTLGPIADRPQFHHPQIERFAAYLVLASLFTLAYPKRPSLLAITLAILAVGLELGQTFSPHRDPGVPDAIAKVAGALTGVALVTGLLVVARRNGQTGSNNRTF